MVNIKPFEESISLKKVINNIDILNISKIYTFCV